MSNVFRYEGTVAVVTSSNLVASRNQCAFRQFREKADCAPYPDAMYNRLQHRLWILRH